MAAVTIRNIPDATHRALKARAARNGRSTEAEIREILADAVAIPEDEGLGTRLARYNMNFDLDLDQVRGTDEPRAADFS
ncbi:FitA-like ribbon-helix-helix domain-containing protein [Aeromicrobium sp.]|uniref:FitA-like ribbon-helix-helix domain-containing protein n=1 Tax=Aeromicrobium sp. TaxID=1871063 RepID=UPI003D6BAD08